MEKQFKVYLLTLFIFLGLGLVAFLFFQKFYPESKMQLSQNNPEKNMLEQNIFEDNPEGLEIEVIQAGDGEKVAQEGDLVSVNYTGWLENGFKFDSSFDRNEPFTFPLGQGSVILGWEKGLLGMKIGEKRRLTIAPNLAYGEQGTPGGPIPPNATLIFEVEMLTIRSN